MRYHIGYYPLADGLQTDSRKANKGRGKYIYGYNNLRNKQYRSRRANNIFGGFLAGIDGNAVYLHLNGKRGRNHNGGQQQNGNNKQGHVTASVLHFVTKSGTIHDIYLRAVYIKHTDRAARPRV